MTAPNPDNVYPGADQRTPSRAQYFSWINNTNEGSTEEQTLINLDFFAWLRDEYGMQLDIYAWDAGAIDGSKSYGTMDSEAFKTQFPRGFAPMYERAKAMDCRLGIWGGPDGFGDTPEDAQARIDMMVSLCRDFEFMLFKFDAVCGQLRPEKQPDFVRMMAGCREHSPDLILLNHRLKLGIGTPHSTTFLWEGVETYIDVHIANDRTATHHRIGAMARGFPPDLQRLTEDHGVCLSSCMDYWDDDLVLQAFGRCLILSPEIYGNPWLLRDDEYPKLARIYNLHRRYRDILVDGMLLPEDTYGPHAVSRGNASTRMLALRNLSWEPTTVTISLDNSIGLAQSDRDIEVRQLHPTERILGQYPHGATAEVIVQPFRACLVLVTTDGVEEPGVTGCDYSVIRHVPGKPVTIELLGLPGTSADIALSESTQTCAKTASLDGQLASELLTRNSVRIDFPGTPLEQSWHRKLADLSPCPVPDDAEALYEATCFAADSNALEVRELMRSGSTSTPQVQAARDAFFEQTLFWARGIWDRYLFDGRMDTFLNCWYRLTDTDLRTNGGALRVDFGSACALDDLVLTALIVPGNPEEERVTQTGELSAAVSDDLVHWHPIRFVGAPATAVGTGPKVARIDRNGGEHTWIDTKVRTFTAALPDRPIRYLRLPHAPDRIAKLEGQHAGDVVDSSTWRASNLFAPADAAPVATAWSGTVTTDEAADGSYLCVAINGTHGVEGAYAGVRCDGRYVGAPDRAPAYQSNAWECRVREVDGNYTYFVPVTPDMVGKPLDIVVLGLCPEHSDLRPEAWLTCASPYKRKTLELG